MFHQNTGGAKIDTGAFPFSWSEVSLLMGVRLALLALSVSLEFAQAVVDNANNTSLTPFA